MTLTMGFVTMPGVAALNRALAEAGLTADVKVINCNAGLSFGRRASSSDAAHGNSAELVEATVDSLRRSVTRVGATLNLRVSASGLDNLTAVGFSAEPHKLDAADLVQITMGPGFLIDNNPHAPCLALVTPADLALDLALLTPFADAPPVWGVYIGQRLNGSWFVITFCIMATWHRLPETEGDLVRQTVREVKRQVEAEGAPFSLENLWVFVGPGASEGFEFKGSRSGKLSQPERDSYVHTELIPNPKAGEPGEADTIEMPYLNLRGWVAGLFRTLEKREVDGVTVYNGVPEGQIFELAHNTVTSVCYKSKRGLMGRGEMPPGFVLASNAMVGVVRRLEE